MRGNVGGYSNEGKLMVKVATGDSKIVDLAQFRLNIELALVDSGEICGRRNTKGKMELQLLMRKSVYDRFWSKD